LFNYSDDASNNRAITYFPNNDVCLGIIHEKQLVKSSDGFILQKSNHPINSYLTGVYSRPHKLSVEGTLDEICLPFTPLGYYHFFRLPLKQYILGEDVLSEAFGSTSVQFFEKLFKEKDFQKRGQQVEVFLQSKLKKFEDNVMKVAFYHLEETKGNIPLKELSSRQNCSEKKLQRSFKQHLDIMPKEYIQILKFREALHYLGQNNTNTLTDICYEAGYYDQSHFIRNINRYTGKKPSELRKSIKSIDQKVLVSFT
jgi:AraC-like DNA-binding protein